MSTQKIAAGLRQREVERDSNVIPLSNLKGAPASISDLNKLASDSSLKSEKLREIADGLKGHLESFEQRKRSEFAELGKVKAENGAVSDMFTASQRKKMLSDAMKAERRSAVAVAAKSGEKHIAELRDARAKLDAVRSLFDDPVSLLKRSTWGSARLARYRDDLAHAGPIEIERAFQTAVLTGDKELGAAAMARLDALSKQQRDSVRVNRRELAENLVADEWRRARQNVAMLEIAIESGEIAATEAEGKAVPSSKKIQLGIKRRDFAGLLSDDDPQKPKESDNAA